MWLLIYLCLLVQLLSRISCNKGFGFNDTSDSGDLRWWYYIMLQQGVLQPDMWGVTPSDMWDWKWSPVATLAVQVAVTPVPPPIARTSSAAVIASREDVLSKMAIFVYGT
ncbi:putative ribonucleoside-diphosphate reductase [Helianthus annuus]|nr:putative ribonucleoside-diphosphate reductase [Helianthus annuus]